MTSQHHNETLDVAPLKPADSEIAGAQIGPDLFIDDLVVHDLELDLTDRLEESIGQSFTTSWDLPESSRYCGWRLRVKRLLDISLALVLAVLLAPVLACVALAVALESTGPVLFKQTRIGRNGSSFVMWKFRSMNVDAEAQLAADPAMRAAYRDNDYKSPTSNDPRITRIGGFLRQSSLDELPQLVSVLRGDMSLVGPRPVVPDELIRSRHSDAYVYATPGITGLWQVEGRSSVGYPERCAYDNDYVADFSLTRDLQLLLRTIPAVLWCRGAH